MSFRYKWKNGRPPQRDEAVRSEHLLDETQFDDPKDHQMAEEMARKYLNLPVPTLDADHPVLPQ